MKKWIAVVLTVGVLAGCNQSDGKEYLGVWKKVNGRGPDTVSVERNGERFIVANTGIFGKPERHPAELKDGALLVHWDELSADTLVIDKKSGHLIGSTFELAR